MNRFKTLLPLLIIVMLAASLLAVAACDDDDDDDDNDDNDTPSDDDDDDNNDDNNDDTTPGDDDDTTPGDDDDDNDTVAPWDDLSTPLGPGEVRAGMITDVDELIGGPRARAEIGDYKIYNSQVEFIIRSPQHSGIGWTGYAGNVIDADRARPPEEAGADGLWGLEQMIGLARGFLAKEVQIVESGADGEAMIRVAGKDGGIHLVDSIAPTWDYELTVVNDYILLPDADYLTIRTTLIDRSNTTRHVLMADLPFWGDETRPFGPRSGFNMDDFDLLAGLRWIGGVNRMWQTVSYALATNAPDHRFWAPYVDGEIVPLIDTVLNIEPMGQATYERLFLVGDGDTDMFPAIINQYDGVTDSAVLTGQINLPVGSDDYELIEVMVTDDRPAGQNYVSLIWPDETGAFSLEVEPGDYTLVASGPGRTDSAPLDVTVSRGQKADAEIVLGDAGIFSYDITDGGGNPVAAKLSFQTGYNAPATAGVAHRIWMVTGMGTERIMPGDYTVTVSRGFEYDIAKANVTIEAGETVLLEESIERVVDSTGYMTADFHIHTQYSIDSQALATSRIKELAAEGIEMPVITDHDTLSNYGPIAAATGADAWLQPVVGCEISPVFGHTNAWPLVADPAANDYYSIRLVEYDENGGSAGRHEFDEIFDIARNEFGAQVVQINHPRASTAWFDWVGYDPAAGVDSVDERRWTENFDAIEVFNSGNNDEGALADWYSFLDQGYTYTMTGNSDSHTTSNTLGNPRNVFSMSDDDPTTADPDDMVAAILAHQNQVSNGVLIDFFIGDESIGGLYTCADGGTVDLEIVVQAAPWVATDYLRVYTNHGTLAAEVALPASTDVVRYDDTITLAITQDSYFVIAAGHTSATLHPVNTERVFGITNPIWVDTDCNGEFDPPGLPVSN
ncbi:MAG: CehA/McbA family metallohydrolase [Candidatus Lernaella stagnicola]|nr:CehA/McbA family metallohydrolase [Candidatus Lernaella stagnicola]